MNGDQCQALYDFAGNDSDLPLNKGEIITIETISSDGWYKGMKKDGTKGNFPINFTEFIKPTEFIMSIICLSSEERKVGGKIVSTVLCKITTNKSSFITEKFLEEFGYLKKIIKTYYAYAIQGLPDLPDADDDLSKINTYLSYLLQCPLLLNVIFLWLKNHYIPYQIQVQTKTQILYVLEYRKTDPSSVYFPNLGQIQTVNIPNTLPKYNDSLSSIQLLPIPTLNYGLYTPCSGHKRCHSISIPRSSLQDIVENGFCILCIKPGNNSPVIQETSTINISYKGYIWCPNASVILEYICYNNVNYVIGSKNDKIIIQGFDKIFPLMKEKELNLVILPPNMGYGEEGCPEKGIPGNSYLIYDITINSVVKK